VQRKQTNQQSKVISQTNTVTKHVNSVMQNGDLYYTVRHKKHTNIFFIITWKKAIQF